MNWEALTAIVFGLIIIGLIVKILKERSSMADERDASAGKISGLQIAQESALELARKANQTIARMKADAKKKAAEAKAAKKSTRKQKPEPTAEQGHRVENTNHVDTQVEQPTPRTPRPRKETLAV